MNEQGQEYTVNKMQWVSKLVKGNFEFLKLGQGVIILQREEI